MKRVICLMAVVLSFAAAGFADIARPDKTPNRVTKPKPSIDTTLSIRLKSDAKEARLIIPRSQLKQLRAELERLDDNTDTAAAAGSFSRTQTIVSGLFLSLAFVFGGIWFARSGKSATRTGKALVIGAVLFAAGAVTTLVYANAGPPPEARSITGKMFAPAVHYYKQGWGKIKLEVSDESNNLELIVPDPQPAAGEE